MNVTREVITDLLPAYFSGEASGDTKALVEDYFRQDPDFERIARSGATPLEALRAATPIAAGREKEKCDLESVRLGLRRRQWLFGLSLFLTLVPISYYFNHGHIASLTDHDILWEAAFDWSLAAGLWFVYFARLPRRTAGLVFAILFTLIPIPFVLQFVFGNSPGLRGNFAEAICFWIGAVFMWVGYFRHKAQETRMVSRNTLENQCSKPNGWLGRFSLWRMNASHSKLTDWGLEHLSIEKRYAILDVGCGGGRTVNKLAAITTQGKVYGVDHSDESVAATKRLNAQWMRLGRVETRLGSVSQLPFPDGMFDLITAVETHFWWPNLPNDMREVFRVLKPGGTLILIAEIYKGGNTTVSRLAEKYASQTGIKLLSVEEHRELFTKAGYAEVQVIEERKKGWICCIGRKPVANS